jgi:DNA modification methylase
MEGQLAPSGRYCQKCGAWRGHLGLEPTPDMFVEHIVEIFREVRRVLRKDGVAWVNFGDTYAGSGGAGGDYNEGGLREGQPRYKNAFRPGAARADGVVDGREIRNRNETGAVGGLKNKDLVGIPWRVAFALQADGWWLRSDMLWIKKSCMPESNDGWRWEKHQIKIKGAKRGTEPAKVGAFPDRPQSDRLGEVPEDTVQYTDCPGCPKCTPNAGFVLRRKSWRPTKAHEYIFMLAKSDHYYCDSDAVRESGSRADWHSKKFKVGDLTRHHGSTVGGAEALDPGAGRNHRSYMILGPEPFKGAHFAAFPRAIPAFAIKSSTSEAGCCPTCGAPWARMTRRVRPDGWADKGPVTEHEKGQRAIAKELYGGNQKSRSIADIFGRATLSSINTLGWKPTCKCNGDSPPVSCVVLDPFAGSGTTLEAAYRLGRASIGIDISDKFMDLAIGRMMKIPRPKVTLNDFAEGA